MKINRSEHRFIEKLLCVPVPVVPSISHLVPVPVPSISHPPFKEKPAQHEKTL